MPDLLLTLLCTLAGLALAGIVWGFCELMEWRWFDVLPATLRGPLDQIEAEIERTST